MKTIKTLIIAVCAAAFLTSVSFAEGKQTCCQKAIAEGKECKRKCCLAAHRDGKSCEKCNPGREDAKLVSAKNKKADK